MRTDFHIHPQRQVSAWAVLLSAALASGVACAPRSDAQRLGPAARSDSGGPPPAAAPTAVAPPAADALPVLPPSAPSAAPQLAAAVEELPTKEAPARTFAYETRTGPVLTPELLDLRARAQARILGAGAEVEDADGVVRPSTGGDSRRENGNELGAFARIENEAALEAFHAALDQLERGVLPGGKLRILAYGASHTQADIYTGYLRYYLQSRFGDAGPGFVQLLPLDKWHRPRGIDLSGQGFSVHHVQRSASRAQGWYGLAGAVGLAQMRGASAGLRLRRGPSPEGVQALVDVYALGHDEGSELKLRIDGREQVTWSTRSEAPELLVHSLSAERPFSELSVEVAGFGTTRLFGATVEWDRPGIVLDTLGISGTRAANWLQWDERTWAEQVQRRNPSLVWLAYGTNESSDVNQPIEHYARDLGEVLARLKRTAPGASCLLIGPGDAAKRVKGKTLPRTRLGPIVETQRRLAHEHGCAFWDARGFMGDGGVTRWAQAVPAMASADLIHLTPRGYVKMGMVLGDALLRAYDAQPTAAETPDSTSEAALQPPRPELADE